MYPEIVQALVGILEVKDISTAAHTWRVILYTRALAEAAGVSNELLSRLTYAAALHDVGKIDIPESVLLKPGPLTPEEFDVMKRHTTLGHERLVRMEEGDPIVLSLVRNHHERWDGKGYPDGLRGEEIPSAARYFSVVDSFDAMTSYRPYRHDVGEAASQRAMVELEAGMGSRYCTEAVELFAKLQRSGQLDWILHHFNDEAPVPEYAALHSLDTIVRDRKA